MAFLSLEQLDSRVSSTSGIAVDFVRDWRQAASRLNAGIRTAFQHGYWLDAWYAAFNVKPGDKLYLPPEQRVHVW